MSAAPPAYRQHGYILIYAMAVLLFLVATLTGAAYALRLNAQENHQQREQLRAEFRLRGALQYALAQFARGATARAAPAAGTAADTRRTENAERPAEKPADRAADRPTDRSTSGWRLEQGSQELQIDGVDVTVAIDDPGGIADANALDERMWADYFAGLGAAQPDAARRWAAAVIAWKERVGKVNGRGGFTGIDDLLMLDALPASVRYGGWVAAEGPDTPAETMPGLPDLFMAGGGERVFDVNRAALPLVAALTGAGAEQLAAYRAARERGKLTVGDAVRILGERARPLLLQSRTDPVFRVVLSTETGTTAGGAGSTAVNSAGANRLSLAALVQRRDGQVRVLSTRLGPTVAVAAER